MATENSEMEVDGIENDSKYKVLRDAARVKNPGGQVVLWWA